MKFIITLLLYSMLTVTLVFATHNIYQSDSITISYSNIYAEEMLSLDSVMCDITQGTYTEHFALSEISTGYYLSRRKVDSLGIILVEIYPYNWNGSDANLVLSDSYISRNVDDFQGTGTQDAGANTVTLVFLDTVNSEVVPFLKHNISNQAYTVDYDSKYSLVDGTRNWSLDAASYYVSISSAVYTANSVPHGIVVSANVTDTVVLYPSATNWPHKSRVYSYILEKDDTGRRGVKVEVTTQYSLRYNNRPVYQFPEVTYTDSSGYFYFDLIRSDSLKPDDKAYYTFKATDTTSGEIIFQDVRVLVPDTTMWALAWWRN